MTVEEKVRRLLQEAGQDDEALIEEMNRLSRRGKDEAVPAILRQLTGKDFSPETACRLWKEALDYRTRSDRMGLRPALLDYLHRIAREIHDPRIIEASQLEEIRQASVTDGLTGLFRQNYFKSLLEREVAQLRRHPEQRFAVVLFDLDHFKQYNDRCGHLAGDQALRQVAEILQDNIREGDVAARYGGEEFILLLPTVNRQLAFKVAERIRRAIEEATFRGEKLLDSGNLTISGGISVYPDDAMTAGGLIEAADRELYQAKTRRNVISPAREDRRRGHRLKVRSLLEFVPRGKNGSISGLALDISGIGMRLGCGSDFPTGTELDLHFTPPFWPQEQRVEAQVRHIRRDPESGLILLGLEFVPEMQLEFVKESDSRPLAAEGPAVVGIRLRPAKG